MINYTKYAQLIIKQTNSIMHEWIENGMIKKSEHNCRISVLIKWYFVFIFFFDRVFDFLIVISPR